VTAVAIILVLAVIAGGYAITVRRSSRRVAETAERRSLDPRHQESRTRWTSLSPEQEHAAIVAMRRGVAIEDPAAAKVALADEELIAETPPASYLARPIGLTILWLAVGLVAVGLLAHLGFAIVVGVVLLVLAAGGELLIRRADRLLRRSTAATRALHG